MVTRIWEFLHKVSYNSTYIRVMVKNLALGRRLSRSCNLIALLNWMIHLHDCPVSATEHSLLSRHNMEQFANWS